MTSILNESFKFSPTDSSHNTLHAVSQQYVQTFWRLTNAWYGSDKHRQEKKKKKEHTFKFRIYGMIALHSIIP